MTKEEIYEKICQWESDNAESFFDYFNVNVNVATYIGFLIGKGYSDFVNKVLKNEAYPEIEKSVLYMDMNEVGEVFPEYDLEGKSLDENCEKNRLLFAEFISLTDIYQRRFSNFIIG